MLIRTGAAIRKKRGAAAGHPQPYKVAASPRSRRRLPDPHFASARPIAESRRPHALPRESVMTAQTPAWYSLKGAARAVVGAGGGGSEAAQDRPPLVISFVAFMGRAADGNGRWE